MKYISFFLWKSVVLWKWPKCPKHTKKKLVFIFLKFFKPDYFLSSSWNSSCEPFMTSVHPVSRHFEYLENLLCNLDATLFSMAVKSLFCGVTHLAVTHYWVSSCTVKLSYSPRLNFVFRKASHQPCLYSFLPSRFDSLQLLTLAIFKITMEILWARLRRMQQGSWW